jgi:hypothetical protein
MKNLRRIHALGPLFLRCEILKICGEKIKSEVIDDCFAEHRRVLKDETSLSFFHCSCDLFWI